MNNNDNSRRDFLKFLGVATAVGLINPRGVFANTGSYQLSGLEFDGIEPTEIDDIVLDKKLTWHKIISWKDAISTKDSFGTNNDYLAFFPTNKKGTEGLLWVNHEDFEAKFVSGYVTGTAKTNDQVMQEMYSVGGCIVKIKFNNKSCKWEYEKSDDVNRRFTAFTQIPFAGNVSVEGSNIVQGTFGNCAGGVTPWKTLLTCEENYYLFVGETIYNTNGEASHQASNHLWESYFSPPPEHYGWVVEIDPFTGVAKKHTSMGRMAHECATTAKAKNGKCVVYTGDDSPDQCLYKFISDSDNSLENGKLYVANLEQGKWISLDINDHQILKANFKTQLDIQIQTRKAAHLVGGTKLHRPEDIEIHPLTGDVYITLTNNLYADPKNYFGSILKISEAGNDYGALSFKHEYFLTGGKETGFACPDNLAFDNKGNLWFTSDISGSLLNKEPYIPFKNNGLFVVPVAGKNAGKVIQIASAPTHAEFTGPYFTPDYKTLFLSVQHPGEYSVDANNLASHFPDGGNSMPKSTVVAIMVNDKL